MIIIHPQIQMFGQLTSWIMPCKENGAVSVKLGRKVYKRSFFGKPWKKFI